MLISVFLVLANTVYCAPKASCKTYTLQPGIIHLDQNLVLLAIFKIVLQHQRRHMLWLRN
jgi:hypothetical protein